MANRTVLPYEEWFSSQRRTYLIEVLTAANFNQCQAAALMEVHRNTVKRMLLDENITPSVIREMRSNRTGARRHGRI